MVDRFREADRVVISVENYKVDHVTETGFISLRCRRKVIAVTPDEIIRRWRVKNGKLHDTRMNLVSRQPDRSICADIG